MGDWQNRVLNEKRELDYKKLKLGLFIDGEDFSKLREVEKELIKDQHKVMLEYSLLLTKRILLFE